MQQPFERAENDKKGSCTERSAQNSSAMLGPLLLTDM